MKIKVKIKDRDNFVRPQENQIIMPRQESDVTHIQQASSTGEALKELNRSDMDPETRRSELDKRTRLSRWEINGMIVIDVLVGFEVLSLRCLTPSMSRMAKNISLDGKGRDDIIKITAGEREFEKETTLGGKMKNAMSTAFGGGK